MLGDFYHFHCSFTQHIYLIIIVQPKTGIWGYGATEPFSGRLIWQSIKAPHWPALVEVGRYCLATGGRNILHERFDIIGTENQNTTSLGGHILDFSNNNIKPPDIC